MTKYRRRKRRKDRQRDNRAKRLGCLHAFYSPSAVRMHLSDSFLNCIYLSGWYRKELPIFVQYMRPNGQTVNVTCVDRGPIAELRDFYAWKDKQYLGLVKQYVRGVHRDEFIAKEMRP